jgi:RNA polymerase sigma-70 factor (ECF subfamily)
MLLVDLELGRSVDDAVTTSARRTDVAVVARARDGDHAAFQILVDDRLEPTFRTALAILGNEADARDATQDIFIRAWRNLPQLHDTDHFQAWFGRIVINTCRSAVRGRGRRGVREIQVASLPDGGENLRARGAAHDVRGAEIDTVERALGRISAADRTLLALHHYEHLPLEEIGAILGVSAKTVKSRLFSARRSFARALEVEQR